MSTRAMVLLVLGVVLFVIGWAALISGVEFKMCSSYVQVPSQFVGRLSPSYSEWYYWRNVVVNLSNVFIRAGAPFSYRFSVNQTVGYIYIELEGDVKKENFSGFLSILNTLTNETVVYTTLSPEKSVAGRGLNTTLFFMKSLDPGNYTLTLKLDSDAEIKKLLIHGPSSREVTVQAIEITLTPSENGYEQIKIDYVCGVDFSRALTASTLVGLGVAAIMAGALLEAYRKPYRIGEVGKKTAKRR